MKKKTHTIGEVSLSALADQWQRDATAAAITAMRGVVQMDGPIPPGTPVGRLSDTEWGWILAAMLFAWISKRAQQATAEQLDSEQTIRMTALDPQPWDSGAVAAILPELADACADTVDWSKPLAQWPRETIIEFLLKAMPLIRKAVIARDLSDRGITRQSSVATIARQVNAARVARSWSWGNSTTRGGYISWLLTLPDQMAGRSPLRPTRRLTPIARCVRPNRRC